MGAHARMALYVTTGVTCAITVVFAMLDAEIKIYLTVWLLAFIANEWLLVAWLVKADHGSVATARARLAEVRLNAALMEEAEADSQARTARRLNSVF